MEKERKEKCAMATVIGSLIIGVLCFIAGSAVTMVLMCLVQVAGKTKTYSGTELEEEVVAESANNTEPPKED